MSSLASSRAGIMLPPEYETATARACYKKKDFCDLLETEGDLYADGDT